MGDSPELLLNLRDNPRVWEVPGGMPEPEDKDPLDTAVRETCEEVGISRKVLGEAYVGCIRVHSKKYPGTGYFLFIFQVDHDVVIDHNFTNEESRGNKFFPLAQLFEAETLDEEGNEFV